MWEMLLAISAEINALKGDKYMLISWKIAAYTYLVKAGNMMFESDVPEEYREKVAKRLIAE